jgi:hypothetical protein
METLRLFQIPLFPNGFDMTLLPEFISFFSGATLTEQKYHIVADINFGGFDLRLDLTADKHHPFNHRGGENAQATVTASIGGLSMTALKATGLHAPVADFLQDLHDPSQSQDALVDLAEPGPIRVKPAGVTGGTGGDKLYVPGVHTIFDLRGVPGQELVELKHGDKVEVSDEKFHNIADLRHHLTNDSHGGWLLAAPNEMANSIDLQLANGHPLTEAQALSYLMLDA